MLENTDYQKQNDFLIYCSLTDSLGGPQGISTQIQAMKSGKQQGKTSIHFPHD